MVDIKIKTTISVDDKELEAIIKGNTVSIPGIGTYTGSGYSLEKITARHVCQLMGYNPMIDPECDGCEERKYQKSLLDSVVDVLELKPDPELKRAYKDKTEFREKTRGYKPIGIGRL